MSEYKNQDTHIYVTELEQASNSYLMAVVSVIAGLPLPIINVIASFFFYLAHRNASYFVRWHCIQSVLSQAVMIPFNSIAFAWTLSKVFHALKFNDTLLNGDPAISHNFGFTFNLLRDSTAAFWLYITFVISLNIIEFIAVITTAVQVRKGKNVRWFLIANITDALTSKQNRDKFRI